MVNDLRFIIPTMVSNDTIEKMIRSGPGGIRTSEEEFNLFSFPFFAKDS
jgi:hypothetical protein